MENSICEFSSPIFAREETRSRRIPSPSPSGQNVPFSWYSAIRIFKISIYSFGIELFHATRRFRNWSCIGTGGDRYDFWQAYWTRVGIEKRRILDLRSSKLNGYDFNWKINDIPLPPPYNVPRIYECVQITIKSNLFSLVTFPICILAGIAPPRYIREFFLRAEEDKYEIISSTIFPVFKTISKSRIIYYYTRCLICLNQISCFRKKNVQMRIFSRVLINDAQQYFDKTFSKLEINRANIPLSSSPV